ncbi:hypothetical protein KJ953_03285 [Patescibacteria group bacterium]|nr:hypothetical protein [Patescibacteria group bacterium]MBU1256638.1 hypothetical protein [Patescibacteria group bacterium]
MLLEKSGLNLSFGERVNFSPNGGGEGGDLMSEMDPTQERELQNQAFFSPVVEEIIKPYEGQIVEKLIYKDGKPEESHLDTEREGVFFRGDRVVGYLARMWARDLSDMEIIGVGKTDREDSVYGAIGKAVTNVAERLAGEIRQRDLSGLSDEEYLDLPEVEKMIALENVGTLHAAQLRLLQCFQQIRLAALVEGNATLQLKDEWRVDFNMSDFAEVWKMGKLTESDPRGVGDLQDEMMRWYVAIAKTSMVGPGVSTGDEKVDKVNAFVREMLTVTRPKEKKEEMIIQSYVLNRFAIKQREGDLRWVEEFVKSCAREGLWDLLQSGGGDLENKLSKVRERMDKQKRGKLLDRPSSYNDALDLAHGSAIRDIRLATMDWHLGKAVAVNADGTIDSKPLIESAPASSKGVVLTFAVDRLKGDIESKWDYGSKVIASAIKMGFIPQRWVNDLFENVNVVRGETKSLAQLWWDEGMKLPELAKVLVNNDPNQEDVRKNEHVKLLTQKWAAYNLLGMMKSRDPKVWQSFFTGTGMEDLNKYAFLGLALPEYSDSKDNRVQALKATVLAVQYLMNLGYTDDCVGPDVVKIRKDREIRLQQKTGFLAAMDRSEVLNVYGKKVFNKIISDLGGK